jgi:hypothetical protein
MYPLLYGHNSEERIVAAVQRDDSTMRAFVRDSAAVNPDTRSIGVNRTTAPLPEKS